MRRFSLLVSCLLIAEWAMAGSLLDYIRDYDLNDYALGLSVASSQNPYVGAENSTYAYPYLTSFSHPAFTDDWLFFRDGDVGVRWISDGGWEFGAVGRVQTLGLGDSEADELQGIADRDWTVEAGPMIGWRAWPIHITLKSYAEISDRHDGLVSQLVIALPFEYSRGFLVPALEVTHQSKDYVEYYYSVTPAEATPARPVYQPDSATSAALQIRWGYALGDRWLLSGTVGVEKLASEITDSPLVDRDRIWSADVGLAYNSDLFQSRPYDDSAPETPKFDLRISAFHDSISTKVAKDTVDGVPGFEVDIEDFLGVPDEKTVLQVDATIRLGHYHRLEFAYFELGRTSSTTLSNDLAFGDAQLPAGTVVDTRVEARVFRAGYSYSLMRDAQKELGLMVGIHVATFETDITSNSTGLMERSKADTPLPVIGAHASIFLSEKTTIGAKVQVFRTDFHRYEGSLNYAMLDIQHRVSDAVSVGLGYSYYGMKLSSKENRLNGYLKVRHHGPAAFFTIGF